MQTLLAYYAAKPNPNTALTESEVVISVHNAAVQTAVGHTLTLLSGAIVAQNPGAVPSLAFPGLIELPSGLFRDGYRKATTHGYDPNSTIQYKDSLDTTGGTWPAASQLVVDTPGIDDRDCQWWYWDGVLYFGSYWYTGTDLVTGSMQAFAGSFAGDVASDIINIAGYPLTGLAAQCTNRPSGYDVDKYILNGGQWPFGSAGSWRRAGLVDRTVEPGHITWIRSTVHQLDESAIVRLDAQTLIMAQRGADSGYANSNLLITRSTDNGATWEAWQVFPFPVGAPSLFLHSSGMLFCAFREYDGGDVLTSLVWSIDGGVTWSPNFLVFDAVAGDSGYPTMAEDGNGHLLITYYEGGTIYIRQVAIDFNPPLAPVATSLGIAGFYWYPLELATYDPAVADWTDQSPAGNDLTWTVAGEKPTLNAQGWDGFWSSVNGDGTNDLLANDAIGALAAGDDTAVSGYCFFKVGAVVNADCVWAFGGSASDHYFSLQMTPTQFQFVRSDGTAATQNFGVADTARKFVAWVFEQVAGVGVISVWYASQGSNVLTQVLNQAPLNRGNLALDRFALMARQRAAITGNLVGGVRELAIAPGTIWTPGQIAAFYADGLTRCPLVT